jgi:hypothetical protein
MPTVRDSAIVVVQREGGFEQIAQIALDSTFSDIETGFI